MNSRLGVGRLSAVGRPSSPIQFELAASVVACVVRRCLSRGEC
jgi:hypothetical protein